jgi:hypothetical protein
MSSVNRSLRLQSKTQGSLDAIGGSLGELFFDNDRKTLRIFNGSQKGGWTLANRDWVDSRLDWANIQNKPTIPVFAAVAVSGSYTDLTNRPVIFSGSYNDLTDKPTLSAATTTTLGLVKVDGTTITISNGVISSSGGTAIDSLSDVADVELTGIYAPTNGQVLKWNSATSTWRPQTISATTLGLGNVTNESKATMFNNPTFTGTVNLGSGVVNLPAGSTIGGSAVATTGLITFSGSTISTSVSLITIAKSTSITGNLTVSGVIGASINALSDVDTASSPPTVGQVLKWDGTAWKPAADVAAGGVNVDADTLDGNDGTYYLDYTNFTNTPDLTLLATLDSPTFTGTVAGITSSMVGLGNVTNESKATMFTDPTFTGTTVTILARAVTGFTGTGGTLVASASPTFTGTVQGITASMVGLGNVTNESKATMFTNPTFTGTVQGVSKSAVGLGNVENTALSTWAGSTSITTVGTLTSALLVNATSGMGYATGQGGTVTQGTSRTTAVSINKLSGLITLFSATAAAGTFSFTVNNTLVTATDRIIVNRTGGGNTANIYIPQVTLVSSGSFRISVYVPSAIAATDSPTLSFLVLKGTDA